MSCSCVIFYEELMLNIPLLSETSADEQHLFSGLDSGLNFFK